MVSMSRLQIPDDPTNNFESWRFIEIQIYIVITIDHQRFKDVYIDSRIKNKKYNLGQRKHFYMHNLWHVT